MRVLKLKVPPIRGDDVVRIQRKLGLDPSGLYDEVTAAAVEDWKWRTGYPLRYVNSSLAQKGVDWLLGVKDPPDEFRQRGKERVRAEAESVAAIDRFIRQGQWRITGNSQYSARSPLEGLGRVFVRVGRRYGVDPRFIVAIATHEGRLGTYKPIQPKHNTFGLGPGRSYPSWEANIEAAARNLARPDGFYVGKNTIREIGLTWAPLGASNDPDDLNAHWVGSVTRFYGRLGGDQDFDTAVKTRPQ